MPINSHSGQVCKVDQSAMAVETGERRRRRTRFDAVVGRPPTMQPRSYHGAVGEPTSQPTRSGSLLFMIITYERMKTRGCSHIHSEKRSETDTGQIRSRETLINDFYYILQTMRRYSVRPRRLVGAVSLLNARVSIYRPLRGLRPTVLRVPLQFSSEPLSSMEHRLNAATTSAAGRWQASTRPTATADVPWH